MEILRTIIRFVIIAIALGILIFLSVSLFRLIPLGIEQLASATVSLGERKSLTSTSTNTDTQRTATPAPVTQDGLNGLYNPNGDIVILDKATTTRTQPNPVATQPTTPRSTQTRTVYYPPVYQNSGRKNLKVTFNTLGAIRNGQFVQTTAFTTTDTVSLKFTILNEEDTETGPWAMRVDMPAALGADKTKILNNLNSIPGESSYTGEVRFDGIDMSQGTPVIRITLDIYNQVSEQNESDNTLAIELRNVANTSYNNGCYYNGSYYNTCPSTTYTTCYYNGTYYYNCINGYPSGVNNNTYNQCWNGSYYYNCNTGYDTGYNNGNYGTPNLYITSFEVGRIVNGSFYAQTTFNYGERIAIRAYVRNNGGYSTNSWSTRLNVYDSNNYSRDISTGTESPIPANGEKVVTYEIDALTRGNNKLTFYVDSSNNIYESNEGDNTTQINVQVY